MASGETSIAFVLSVLTGDTLLVRYCEKTENKYAVIILPIACAPTFSIFLNSAADDPFALESLNFLRQRIENKRVLIGPSYPNKGPKIFTHQTLGSLPISINSVNLLNDPHGDIDAYLIKNGFACIREDVHNNDPSNQSWLSHYGQLQETAIANKLGIWGGNPESVDYHSKNQFESVIISINNDFTFKLLSPNINVELAGVTQKGRTRSQDFNIFLGENVLFHKVTVRILQRLPGAPTPLVSISINNFDLAILLLTSNYVAMNEITSHFLDNENDIRQIMISNTKQFDHEFTATVTKILSSNSFLVEDCKTIVLSHIIVPKFDFLNSLQDAGGIEAFRFLRDNLLYKTVSIDITIDNGSEIYGVVTVDNKNINQLMVKQGYAKIAQSRIQGNPPFMDDMKLDNEAAKRSILDIHSDKPKPANQKDVGILYDVVSINEITIYINDKLTIFELTNLTTSNFSYSNIYKCTEILKSKFLFHDVLIQRNGAIIDLSSNQDIRIPLLENGLATLVVPEEDLSSAVEKGKTANKTTAKPLSTLNFDDPFVIRRVISPTTFIVQAQSMLLTQLHKKLVSIQLHKINTPIIGGIYIVQINQIIYRCNILDSNSYLLIDYGYIFPITIGELHACPEELMAIPPQSFCVSLVGAQKFINELFEKQALKFISNFFDQNDLYDIKLCSPNNSFIIPKVKIFGITNKYCVNNAMIQNGLIKLDQSFDRKTENDLFVIEEEAKNKKIGGWALL